MKISFRKDINNADRFVKLCSSYKEDVELHAIGKYIVNAKSSLGVASCAGYDDLEVIIKADDHESAEKFYNAVKEAGFAK